MKKNIGTEDRIARLLVGTALIINIPVLMPGIVVSIVLAVAGIALIATGIVGFCSLYLPLKLDTRNNNEKLKDSAQQG